ncbi:FAD-dependent oxidoreductase [Alphaproteobacteria bacterium]|nr:FAD-dependent oxidoreductase [Alphaproteobacteria bacterium]
MIQQTNSSDPLLTPFRIGRKTIKNRIFSTGHALSHASQGRATDTTLRYQMEKAKGGIGLSFVGGSGTISVDTAPVFDQLIIDDAIMPFFQQLSDFYHSHNAILMTQITHLGRRTNSKAGEWLPMISASANREVLHRGFPREMDEDDIFRIIRDFASAAKRCKESGLDGLEVIASGHLMDQFWSPVTNQRIDKYGGSLENRMRFSRMVFAAMREAAGDDFLLGVRMTMTEQDYDKNGLSEADNIDIASCLKNDGVIDFLNLVSGRIDSLPRLTSYMPGMAAPLSPFLEQAGRFKQAINLPIFHATRINDLSTARYAVTENVIDMVGMTRGHIADPYIVAKLERGDEDRIRTCVGSTYCSNYGYCIQNPATAREATLPHVINKTEDAAKTVVVIGGGPAGCEAARVAAERGHHVILFEASDRLGGQINLAGKVSWRKDLNSITEWLAAECQRLGVDIRCNHFADEAMILSENPDVVIMATGGIPHTEWVEGNANILTTWDVLSGMASPEGNVFIHDQTGLNVAMAATDYLSEKGVQVTLNTQDAHIGHEAMRLEMSPFMKRFYERGVIMQPDHELIRADAQNNQVRVTIRNMHTAALSEHDYDHIIVEAGTLPNDELFYAMREGACNKGVIDLDRMASGQPQPVYDAHEGYHLYRIGDVVGSRDIHCAMLDALRICARL